MFKKFNPINLLIQLSLWVLLFITPLVSQILNNTPWAIILDNTKYYYPQLLILPIIFYVNYFIFIPRLLFKKRNLIFTLANITLSYILVSIFGLYLAYIQISVDYYGKGVQWTIALVMAILCLLVILAAISFRSQQRNALLELKEKEAKRMLAEQELHRLKSQLNPHFLFNTLNNISSLVGFNQDAAQESLSRLSDMLRYVLYDSSVSFIPLKQEVQFMENYIDLMKLRYSDRLKMNIRFPSANTEARIAPLLYISLLENAFKYGASSRQPCYIDIGMDETPLQINFLIKNSLLNTDERQTKSEGGVGIENLKKRLQLIYPERHRLDYGTENENGIEAFVLKLTIDKH